VCCFETFRVKSVPYCDFGLFLGLFIRRTVGVGATPDIFGGAHRVQDAGDHLRSPRANHIVGGTGLEQLGVRKDDPKLVIEAMKQRADFGFHLFGAGGFGRRLRNATPRRLERLSVHACWPAVTGPGA
jgi:hypothetical protein